MNSRQKRYEELVARDENLTDEELKERVQLFYELDTSRQYWRDKSPNITPGDIWGIDASCYDE